MQNLLKYPNKAVTSKNTEDIEHIALIPVVSVTCAIRGRYALSCRVPYTYHLMYNDTIV